MLLEVHFSDEFSQFDLGSLGLSTDGEVTKRFNSVLVLCNGFRNCLGHFLQICFCLVVIKQRAEGELFSDVLCIIRDAILSSYHVEEVIKAELNAHAHVVEGQSAHLGLHVISHEFSLNGGLDGFRCIFAVACGVHCIKHVLDRLLDGLSVLVEQLEGCDGVSIATDI